MTTIPDNWWDDPIAMARVHKDNEDVVNRAMLALRATMPDDNMHRIGVVGAVWATLYPDGWTVYAEPAHRFGQVETGLTETDARALIEIVKTERN